MPLSGAPSQHLLDPRYEHHSSPYIVPSRLHSTVQDSGEASTLSELLALQAAKEQSQSTSSKELRSPQRGALGEARQAALGAKQAAQEEAEEGQVSQSAGKREPIIEEPEHPLEAVISNEGDRKEVGRKKWTRRKYGLRIDPTGRSRRRTANWSGRSFHSSTQQTLVLDQPPVEQEDGKNELLNAELVTVVESQKSSAYDSSIRFQSMAGGQSRFIDKGDVTIWKILKNHRRLRQSRPASRGSRLELGYKRGPAAVLEEIEFVNKDRAFRIRKQSEPKPAVHTSWRPGPSTSAEPPELALKGQKVKAPATWRREEVNQLQPPKVVHGKRSEDKLLLTGSNARKAPLAITARPPQNGKLGKVKQISLKALGGPKAVALPSTGQQRSDAIKADLLAQLARTRCISRRKNKAFDISDLVEGWDQANKNK